MHQAPRVRESRADTWRPSMAGPRAGSAILTSLPTSLCVLRGGVGRGDTSAEGADDDIDAGANGDQTIGSSTFSANESENGVPSDANKTLCGEDVVFGMRKGAMGTTSGGWAMDTLRRVCWYFLDILVVEAQHLRFAGHLLAAAGVVRQEKIPSRMKRRRGRWWRAPVESDARVAARKQIDGEKGKASLETGSESDDDGRWSWVCRVLAARDRK